MIRDIYPSGFDNFVVPFMVGLIFVLSYCSVAAVRVIAELSLEDRRRFLLSLISPRIVAKNIKDWFLECLIHVKLWRRNRLLGYMHSSIAFGWFMLILFGHIEVLLYLPDKIHRLWYPVFFRYFVAVSDSTIRGAFFFFMMDFFLLVVLSGIVLAIFKRITSRPFGFRRTTMTTVVDHIGMYALWSIFPLRLLAEGFTADISGGEFLTKSLNVLLHRFFSDSVNALPVWWAYSVALGVFLVVLPFSRYMHIPAEMLLIALRNSGVQMNGAKRGLSRAQIYSCPGCGVCIDGCPMSSLSERVADATVYLNRYLRRCDNGGVERSSDSCLLCGRCAALCPVGVQGDKMRVALRAERDSGIVSDYSAAEGAFYTDTAKESVHLLYFMGCMTALTPAISRSVVAILDRVGENYRVMDGGGGICCGRPMMVSGRVGVARQMIEINRRAILASGAQILLVSCPICYRIFKEEYHLEGVEVLHHSEYIDRLICSGRVVLERGKTKFVYHDPCELGRGSGIYAAPRRVVAAVGEVVEAEQGYEKSICCGGSLGSLTLDDKSRSTISLGALRSLQHHHPDVIVTACPLCKSTLSRYAECAVMDIAEIVLFGSRIEK